jgi:hypothetical protein
MMSTVYQYEEKRRLCPSPEEAHQAYQRRTLLFSDHLSQARHSLPDIMSDETLIPPKPAPELNIPASKNTVKVSCIDT